MPTRYKITGVSGDAKGRPVRRTITTAHSRKEAIHVARRVKNDRGSNYTRIRIEPVSEARQKDEPLNRLDRSSQAEKARRRRGV